ncbi:MAG: glutaredoxin 3 [Agarilytica sp.]
MSEITIYTTKYCGYCYRAKALLDGKGVTYTEIAMDGDRQGRKELAQKSGQHTVPQIWIGEKHIGGCDELTALDSVGQLDALLAS